MVEGEEKRGEERIASDLTVMCAVWCDIYAYTRMYLLRSRSVAVGWTWMYVIFCLQWPNSIYFLPSQRPYSVNMLIGGFDTKNNKPELFWLDYLGAMTSLPFGAQGYGAYFCTSLMDRYHYPDMDVEEAKELLRKCLEELRTRFIVNLPKFTVKLVNKDGITDIEL